MDEFTVIDVEEHVDRRGQLQEVFNLENMLMRGLTERFVHVIHSHSKCRVVRGLHYQLQYSQAKLIYVVQGKILDVAVDIRLGSDTFGHVFTHVLDADEKRELIYIPKGYAHGFSVLSEDADVVYMCSNVFVPDDCYGIAWDDRDLAINWRVKQAILSKQDRGWPTLKEADALPVI